MPELIRITWLGDAHACLILGLECWRVSELEWVEDPPEVALEFHLGVSHCLGDAHQLRRNGDPILSVSGCGHGKTLCMERIRKAGAVAQAARHGHGALTQLRPPA